MWALRCLLGALLASVVLSAVPADEVTSLPGWQGKLPSRQYSGYLDISHGRHLHYWLVESESSPAQDPLVIWMNGGPGCSSLDGYFYEQGPFRVVEPYPNTTTPSLYLNEHRWNKIANMIFLESPACVGFSYADTPAGCRNNDTQQAVDTYAALLAFYKGFPEYAANGLYITGESYAGVYVPTLALEILKNAGGQIPLKGIAVGNGVVGDDEGRIDTDARLSIEFLYGKGLYSRSLHQRIQKVCTNLRTPTEECLDALGEMGEQVGRVNIYDILAPCVNDGFPGWRRPVTASQRLFMGLGAPGGPDACIDAGAATAYLNRAEVKAAINVRKDIKWEVCTDRLQYDIFQGPLQPYYRNVLIPSIRVLIYAGDNDACVPYNGNEEWTSSLNLQETKPWHPWIINEQVAGYATTYENDFAFVTIKGAGHMVPQTHPAAAFEMFRRFINGEQF